MKKILNAIRKKNRKQKPSSKMEGLFLWSMDTKMC
ncbi:hypothetical protein QO009_002061 [Brevibacillus aydinogluensis]|nr:hypothetical protein [Brevibacillus aydinogluensis]